MQETDPEAYALFLQARHLGRLGTAEGWEQSNALYQQALAIDPDYAAAWDGLANNYRNQASYGLLPADEGSAGPARRRSRRWPSIPTTPRPMPASAGSRWYYDNDLAQAARHFERALQLDPANIDIIRDAAALLQSLGRLDEAIALDEYVTARDPVNPDGHATTWATATSTPAAGTRPLLPFKPPCA